MPELPDLQVFSKNLTRQLRGRKIKTVAVHVSKASDKPAAFLRKKLKGKKLLQVGRDGKEMFFHFDDGSVFSLHLMLHGKVFILEKGEDTRFRLVDFVFEDGSFLTITDFQKKANIRFNPPPREAPDALSAAVNYQYIKDICNQKRTAIKKLLMDQSLIRGIGNAYADEILWSAGISPFSIAGKIPPEKLRILAKEIKRVLKDAEKKIARSHPGIIQGEVRDFLNIHNSKKEKSPGGSKIQKRELGGRPTYFTQEQNLYE